MGAIRKAKRSSGPDLELSRSELLTLPARLLTKLPLETRIFVQAAGTKNEFVLTSALLAPVEKPPVLKPRGERLRPCWLAASEVDALVLGVEAERVFAADLTGFALRKLHDPKFLVTEEHALAGAQHPEAWQDEIDKRSRRPAMTLGEVFEALDLEITCIEVGPLAPAVGQPESIPAHAA